MADFFLNGFVGAIPEMKEVRGIPVAEFIVQINGGKTDNPKKIWVKCSAWHDLAELVKTHVFQGDLVGINGRIFNVDAWIDKKGKPQGTVEIRADEISKSLKPGMFKNIKEFRNPGYERLPGHPGEEEDSIPF